MPNSVVSDAGDEKVSQRFLAEGGYEPLQPVGQKRKKLSLCKMVAFSAPTVATLPFILMFGMYGNQYYASFGASLSIIALFTALARSFDIVSDPIMSYITDSASWCGDVGRRRPFMFIGCFFYAGFLYLLLRPPYGDSLTLSMWYGIMSTCFFLCATFVLIPYDALGPELSDDPEERTSLFFVSNLFDGVGTLVALALPIAMTQFAAVSVEPNNNICKGDAVVASHCLAGQSCAGFLSEGSSGAFIANSSLADILANVSRNTTLLAAQKPCLDLFMDYNLTRISVLGQGSTLLQNTEFCSCVAMCNASCDIANKRAGFSYVGIIFSVWFVVTMFICVWVIKEREPSGQPAPPIVPSLRSTFKNKPFRTLIPAWMCDALSMAVVSALCPYFIEAVVAPEYMTMEEHGVDCYRSSSSFEGGKWQGLAGQSTSETFNWRCRNSNILALCGGSALIAALVALPLWKVSVKMFGKVQTWLWWSLTMAGTNVLFLVIQKGWIWPMVAVSAVNGLPLGAKFLADSILADIVDYDEFVTGQRREATYFMFRSLIPKVVMVPTTALPLALLGPFGYRQPVGGRPSLQPLSVHLYIKGAVMMGFVAAMLSWMFKRGYPLKTEKDLLRLREGIESHKRGEVAQDPLREDAWYRPPDPRIGPEKELFDIICHFSRKHMHRLFDLPEKESAAAPADLQAGVSALTKRAGRELAGSFAFTAVAMFLSGMSMPLIFTQSWQFVPTLMVIFMGFSFTGLGYFLLRFRAAHSLRRLFEDGEVDPKMVERILRHREAVANVEMEEPPPEFIEMNDVQKRQYACAAFGGLWRAMGWR